MSRNHYFDIQDFEGYSIIYVGDKSYEFRIANEDLLFEVVSSLLGVLLITEKVFPVVNKSNIRMMNFYVSHSHDLVQLYNEGKIGKKMLMKFIKFNVDSARKSKTKVPAQMVSSIESDFKQFEPRERIRLISQTIFNMEQYKIVMEACNTPISIAEEARLSGLKNYLEHERTKLELGIEPAHEPLKGYECSRSKADLISIYKRMTTAGYLKADQSDFLAIFKDETIVEFKPLVWCIKAARGKNVGKGNKAALREFLKQCLKKESLSAEDKRKAMAFFIDENGTPMTIQNPSKDESSSIDFNPIFSGLA